ncbi:MAG TPA: amidase family protein [Vicinamibacterales bacterium]|nr:amidase family protein [Vicinamibacterales bacterium]
MAINALVGQTACALAAFVRKREATPVDIVRSHLARIEQLDPVIGAFQVVRGEKAVVEAEVLSRREDLHRLPLAGVPIAIKDNVQVAGEPMRVGSLATPETPCAADHETVRRLRAAGAIVLGITRVPELCVWATTDSAFGVTRNPWDRERTAGGSSGGSAAALAAAMIPLALGADGLGSIRIPAASCGILGLKPGPEIVPAQLGVSSWFGLAESGPMATTVEDAALMLSVLADREDLAHADPPASALRIAFSTRSPLAGVRVDRELRGAVLESAKLLAAAGHLVEEADPPAPTLRSVAAILGHWFGGASQEAEMLELRRLEPRNRTHVRLGRLARRLGLVRAKDREAWRAINDPFFRRFDLLLTPVLASTPISCDRWSERGWIANMYANLRFAPFAGAWNFAGYPAASVPAGVHSDGTPLSVQIVTSLGRERLILSVARQLEILRPWPRHAPARAFQTG